MGVSCEARSWLTLIGSAAALAKDMLSLAAKLNQSGKTVRIVEPNELVRVLLSALGIEGVASIVKA